jgi:hypothetical protein
VLGWALLFMMPFRFLTHQQRPNHLPGEDARRMAEAIRFDPMLFRIESGITNVLLAIFFYTNMFVLIPRVLSKKGKVPYFLVVLLSFILYILIGYLVKLQLMPAGISDRPFGPPAFMSVPNFLMVFGLSLALRIMQDRTAIEATLKERENEKLKSELSFLRSQVSPHFMFNVLNSLASLARKKSDKVEDAIIQLSQLMRYSLYHTDKKVSLEQEAEYLSNYIELQRLRFGAIVTMNFHVNIEKKDLVIEPMLLVPFVENAFKHGVGLIQDPVIVILLEATAYNISFSVRNRFNAAGTEIKDEGSGIGLQNVKRRLDLLYKDLYSLHIYKSDDGWFVTELKIIPE